VKYFPFIVIQLFLLNWGGGNTHELQFMAAENLSCGSNTVAKLIQTRAPTPLTTFTCFLQLPVELQLQIWELCCAMGPRIFTSLSIKRKKVHLVETRYPIHALTVCFISRKVAKKTYERQALSGQSPIHIDRKLDVLYLNSSSHQFSQLGNLIPFNKPCFSIIAMDYTLRTASRDNFKDSMLRILMVCLCRLFRRIYIVVPPGEMVDRDSDVTRQRKWQLAYPLGPNWESASPIERAQAVIQRVIRRTATQYQAAYGRQFWTPLASPDYCGPEVVLVRDLESGIGMDMHKERYMISG